MIDIHCHILPGLDDGSDSFEMSCAMAESAIADGITHIIATPHASPDHVFLPDMVRQRRDELQERFAGKLIFATGCDFHLSYENLQDVKLNPSRYSLNQKNYLLVEFADFSIPPSMDQALHELQFLGLTPVITHPERNPLIRTKPERLFRWLRQGCYAQVTAQSLLGKFGRAAQDMTLQWLDAGAIHFVASDAHNTQSRPLKLREAYDRVRKLHSEEVAEALFVQNPLAVFEGRPLEFVPELDESLGQAPGATPLKRKKRFWFF
ncbi:MAG: CpsB/CapC family capsule biosynthesis tyrosine phosphatase [Candidatus Acidiferrales bacterium]